MISKPPEWADYKEAPITGSWFKRWLKSRFRFVDYPFLLAYRGYGNPDTFIIQGHVFRGMALSRPRKRHSAWKNFIGLIKMFLIRTVPQVRVQLNMDGIKHTAETNENGFFEFEINSHGLHHGWHQFDLMLLDELVEGQEEISLEAEVMIQDDFEYGLISDIDDTFLVSHVTKGLRKLYLLLTKNSESRKPFKGVVNFYNLLGEGVSSKPNPFFYVSSSEWNLYDFLIRFMRFHDLPKGVLQLKDLKDSWTDFFKSGFGSHDHKRLKIERILKMYPDKQFILLGDNGQHDPYIYRKIAEDFPGQVKAIYIRAVKRSHRDEVNRELAKIDAKAIPSLQFKRSAEAMEHARREGFILKVEET